MYDNRGRLRQKEAGIEQNFEWRWALAAIAVKICSNIFLNRAVSRAIRADPARPHYRRDMPVIQIVRTSWKQASTRHAPLLAAGVAFYAFLSLFPALIAAVLLYGLIASPDTVKHQSANLTDTLPDDAASVITGQLNSLTSTSNGSLGIGLILALALALYSASSGVGNLVTAINVMFGITDTRNFIKRKLLALGLTACAIAFLIIVIALVAAAPAIFDALDVVPGLRALLEVGRWAILLGALVIAIGVLFRVAPDRAQHPRLVTKGVLVTTAMWVAVSVGFSVYVDNFGRYSKTYGALAGVVILLLWLWIGLYAILLGATIEAREQDHDD